ncbi:hypothetical protein J537_0231 [Acinetobacter baumannii 1437282]|nr:hypothetical protein ACINWC323_2303 [Acinetobacter sp. WC-323]EXB28240.1 hypothetical protein J537_0231 [Acinetobacter baumannii 1437282]
MAIGLISDTLMHTPCLQVESCTCFYVFNLAKIQLKDLN